MSSSSQLALNLTPCLSYSAKYFVRHHGVSPLFGEISALLESSPPKFSFVYAPARFGKTHFSIALADKLISLGLRPVLLEASDFSKLVFSGSSNYFLERESLVVDDADQFFNQIQPGNSGPIVRFFEELRVKGVGLVLLSSTSLNALPCDEHIMSRIRGCAQMQILMPDENTLPEIVDNMLKQRGMALGGRKIKFLKDRVQRSIPEIERYLTRLQHLSEVMGRKVTFRTLGDALGYSGGR